MTMNCFLFIVAVLAAIIIGSKTKTNMGLWAIVFALLLGYLRLGTTSTKLLAAQFPVGLFYNTVCVTLFFGFSRSNGTINLLADKLRYATRKASWFAPISVFLLSWVLTVCGANALVVGPFTYSIALAMGIDPFIGIAACNFGQGCFLLMPFCQTGGTNVGVLQKYFSQEQSLAGMYFTGACMIAFFTIEYIVVTLIFKAYKPKKAVAEVEMQAPPAFNPVQRKNLIVIVVVLLLLLVPTLTQAFFPNPVSKTLSNVFSMQVLWTGGALLLALIGCGNLKEVLTKRVPWDTIMLVMGMSVLFGMAKDMGVIDLMNIVLNKVPAWSIVPTLASICAVLSLFVSGSIITPMFVSMAETFSTITGVSLNVIIMAITGGAFVSSISPVSAGGAAALLGCDDENIRPRLIKLQTATALINIVLVFPFVLLVSKLF